MDIIILISVILFSVGLGKKIDVLEQKIDSLRRMIASEEDSIDE